MSSLFISHSSADNDIAKQLEQQLAQQNHHSVFLDLDPELGIVAGQSWEQTLYRKLRACKAVIALCTDRYLESHWCFAEIALARMEGKTIFALLVDPLSPEAQLPAILTEKQFIDLRQAPEMGYQRLWRGLQEMDLLGVAGEWNPRRAPYLGLNAYQEEHAALFFGREAETQAGLELLNRGAPNWVMVLGASGSGKSSLVRAGILPRLRREADQWLILDPFRPGQDPFMELAEALALAWRRYAVGSVAPTGEILRARLRGADLVSHDESVVTTDPTDVRLPRLLAQLEELRQSPPAIANPSLLHFLNWSLSDLQRICGQLPPSDPVQSASPLLDAGLDLRRRSGHRHARILLVIDQFEELLTPPNEQSTAFLQLLHHALAADQSPLMLLATMRSDYLGLFQHQAALQGLDFESLSVGPMPIAGMRRVIEEPAKLGAITLETGLADRLLADTGTPDALPLLSFTLWSLWRNYRADGRLEVAEYEAMGGLQGALAREADVLLAMAEREQQVEALRGALVKMARLSESGSYVRQPLSWVDPAVQPIQTLLQRFIERRLLAIRTEAEQRLVEVTHEALFRTWVPLKTWLDEQRADLLLMQQIHHDALAWEARQCPQDTLWRGGRLLQARDVLEQLQGCDRTFIQTGLRYRRRQLWARWGTATAAFMVLVGCLGFALINLREANIQQIRAYIALSDAHLAANRGIEARIESIRAALQVRQSFWAKVWPTSNLPQLVRIQLQKVLLQAPERHRLEAHQDTVRALAFSPDSQWLATVGSNDQTLRLWDARQGMELPPLQHNEAVLSVAFSPDSQQVVTSGDQGRVRIWSVNTRQELAQFQVSQRGRVWGIAYSPDGSQLATCGPDQVIRLWDAQTYELQGQLQGHQGLVLAIAYHPDGQRLVSSSADGTLRVWNPNTYTAQTQIPIEQGVIQALAFSPDGQYLATGGLQRTAARIWQVSNWQPNISLEGHYGEIWSVAFSGDGKKLVTAGADSAAHVWDVLTGEEITALRGHQGGITAVSFAPNGQQLMTGSRDHTVRLWDVTRGERIIELNGEQSTFNGMALSPTVFSDQHRHLATISTLGAVQVWDAQSGREGTALDTNGDRVLTLAFSPDGQQLATTNTDGETELWQVTARRKIKQLTGHQGAVEAVTFDPQGQYLATAGRDRNLRIWDLNTESTVLSVTDPKETVLALSFNANGQLLATGGHLGTLKLWQTQTGRPHLTLTGHQGPVLSLAFHPQQPLVASGGADRSVRLWHTGTGQELLQLRGHQGGVIQLAFTKDGRWLAAGSNQSDIRLWDTRTGEPLLRLEGHRGRVFSALFSPEGNQLVTGGEDGTLRRWDVAHRDFEPLLRQNCEQARFYLRHNPNVEARDRTLCQTIPLP